MVENLDTETVTSEKVNFGTSGPVKNMELLELKREIEGVRNEKEKIIFIL
ncbi:hypothetical protein THOM_0208 [Trachipleistophora hominis]|uniref:Uncharacterized protein n=1 Tax=Trachipleistophora hominis TaxID=72359 RepID=L7JZC1_TRAHO|nr:hypothetical protein THOM_0208 [Trachipleistophora hominis]